MVGSSLRASKKRVKKQMGRAVGREGLVSPSTRILRQWVLPLNSCDCLVSLHVVHRG